MLYDYERMFAMDLLIKSFICYGGFVKLKKVLCMRKILKRTCCFLRGKRNRTIALEASLLIEGI